MARRMRGDDEVGAEIRRLRTERGLRQQDLAELVGLERTSITNIEAGNQTLLLPVLRRIADALDMELVVEFRPR
jgi:transcriptional regulator with XRE-family HTH domain